MCACVGDIFLFGWICLKMFWKDILRISNFGFLLGKEDVVVRRWFVIIYFLICFIKIKLCNVLFS